MNAMRTKILGFLTTALVLASFGLFAGAANAAKIYTMVVQSTSPTTVAVTIHNVTPENNSTISSFIINPPRQWRDAGSIVVLGAGNGRARRRYGGVKVNGFQGLKSSNRNPNTITIDLTVNWGGAGTPGCGSTVNWTASVYTGNFSNTTLPVGRRRQQQHFR